MFGIVPYPRTLLHKTRVNTRHQPAGYMRKARWAAFKFSSEIFLVRESEPKVNLLLSSILQCHNSGAPLYCCDARGIGFSWSSNQWRSGCGSVASFKNEILFCDPMGSPACKELIAFSSCFVPDFHRLACRGYEKRFLKWVTSLICPTTATHFGRKVSAECNKALW